MYNGKKRTTIIVMMVAVLVMVVGYAAFSTNIRVGGTANVTSNWNVYISNVETKTVFGKATNAAGSPTFENLTATMNVTLIEPGDYLIYEVTITNSGLLGAVVEDIKATNLGTEAIKYSVDGISNGDKIASGKELMFTITIEYDKTLTSQPEVLNNTLTLDIKCVQDLSGNTDGDGGSITNVVFNKESQTDLTFTSDADLSTFQEVKVDNITVDSSNYTLTSGSTIVTLKKEYLNALSAGMHTLDIISTSGTYSTTFEVTTTKSSASLIENIYKNNEVYADNVPSKYATGANGIDFSAKSSDTNGKGLYYTSTNTEDNKVSYYYRGAVDNNYVKFGKANSGEGTCTYNGELVYSSYTLTQIGAEKDECVGGNYCLYYSSIEKMYRMFLCSATLPSIGFSKINDTPTYIESQYEEDMLWRIVRINEDGSIRLIYNGTSTSATGNDVTIGTSAFNTNSNNNAHVGYMYGLISTTLNDTNTCITYDSTNNKAITSTSTYSTKSACETAGGVWTTTAYEATHANVVNSTVKTVLDNWYQTNLPSYSDYIADAGFCNDRSLASGLGVGNKSSSYGAKNRLVTNKTPQFACPNVINDLFTTSS